ncbi:MAG: hypothetical protein LBP71_07155, partial [Spirochaetaceae bacterium]|nr:hypothetical protein [Spirochaetaceae bacterium]
EKRNYFQEELTLLDPDIIIAANLWGGKVERQYLDLCFGEKARENPVGYYPNKNSPNGILYEFELNGKKIKLIDLYHFSRFGVCDQDYYFSPVKNLLFPG